MPKYIELSSEEIISTAEIFGAVPVDDKNKEVQEDVSDQKLCEHNAQ